MITIKARQEYVKQKLATDKTWAIKGMQLIYSYQTCDEKNMGETKYDNNIGFSGAHGEIMSSFARQYEAKKWLSDNQLKVVFKIMPKYWKQILATCNDEILLQCMLKDGIITAAEFVEVKL
jgi:hypothetical protein